jgi:hypothetical protein
MSTLYGVDENGCVIRVREKVDPKRDYTNWSKLSTTSPLFNLVRQTNIRSSNKSRFLPK